VSDLERARVSYCEGLGWRLSREGDEKIAFLKTGGCLGPLPTRPACRRCVSGDRRVRIPQRCRRTAWSTLRASVDIVGARWSAGQSLNGPRRFLLIMAIALLILLGRLRLRLRLRWGGWGLWLGLGLGLRLWLYRGPFDGCLGSCFGGIIVASPKEEHEDDDHRYYS
jgi:hypothetical protein